MWTSLFTLPCYFESFLLRHVPFTGSFISEVLSVTVHGMLFILFYLGSFLYRYTRKTLLVLYLDFTIKMLSSEPELCQFLTFSRCVTNFEDQLLASDWFVRVTRIYVSFLPWYNVNHHHLISYQKLGTVKEYWNNYQRNLFIDLDKVFITWYLLPNSLYKCLLTLQKYGTDNVGPAGQSELLGYKARLWENFVRNVHCCAKWPWYWAALLLIPSVPVII